MAVEKENIEIIKLLLTNDKLNINLFSILNIFIIKIQNHICQLHSKSFHFLTLKIISFNEIHNHIFQLYWKLYHSITFKIISSNHIQNHIIQ